MSPAFYLSMRIIELQNRANEAFSRTELDEERMKRMDDLIAQVDAPGRTLDESRNCALLAVRILKEQKFETAYRGTSNYITTLVEMLKLLGEHLGRHR